MITFLFLFTSLTATSQVTEKEIDNFLAFAYKHIGVNSFKDSTALYTCNLQLNVDKKNDYRPVLTSKDLKVSSLLKGIDSLKNYDFKKMMGNRRSVKFILPVAIIIIDSSNSEKKIDVQGLSEKVRMLSYYNKEEDNYIINLFPIIIMADRKVYN